MSGVLFCIAGLLYVMHGNVPVGMLFICIGLMFTTTNRSRRGP